MKRIILPAVLVFVVGCRREQPTPPAPKPPEVQVAVPLKRDVVDLEIFTGRTEASERADLRSRVTGNLDKVYFDDGEVVTKGKVLFLIDPRPWQAELAEAEAMLARAEATLKRADADHARGAALFARNGISREEYDRLVADLDLARADLRVVKAKGDRARLNLDYSQIRAPFSGRVSRRMIDPGNLVKADETILTTIVAVDPMHAYFDVDERTLLRKMLKSGEAEYKPEARRDIEIGLADEEGFPHRGVVNFFDNKLDTATGSLWMRGEFIKPSRTLSPGMFIRVRFPLSRKYPALLVSEQAIGSDQGRRFVYVVDDENKVNVRPVTVGRLQDDGTRVILSGLKATETIVVNGLQRVRPNISVSPKTVDMPVRK